MEIDLNKLAEWIMENNLMDKPLKDFTKEEILQLFEQAELVTYVANQAYSPPYIKENGTLVIPADAHPKHKYWEPTGQSIRQTLQEMEVSDEIMERYAPKSDND
ncbi:MAG: hypothetical protein HOJ48_01175 [Desulfobacula sp.]|jgi:hypothetical protein|nr:hypothetical protein [Desulfobacula sp.]MBT6337886.1 hypothetical protein [Desulfobacula sp.]